MDPDELKLLKILDAAVAAETVSRHLEAAIPRVERALERASEDVLAWEPIPLDVYDVALPAVIRSSWVFVLRGGTTTGAERHPNSHQRMMSYRGSADFPTKIGDGPWVSHPLESDPSAPIERRWISIPPNVWHQGVVPAENWVVVSFHTVRAEELIEERPDASAGHGTRQRTYVGGEADASTRDT